MSIESTYLNTSQEVGISESKIQEIVISKINEAIKKYNIDPNKPEPTTI